MRARPQPRTFFGASVSRKSDCSGTLTTTRLLPFGFGMTSNLTRRQLYDPIWSHELSQVSAHLGISEWQIRQICESHRVPLPTAAFWRDRADGRRTKQAVFMSTMDAALEVISFKGTQPTTPLPVSEPAPTPKIVAPKREVVARARSKRAEWAKVDKPYPALLQVAAVLRTAKPDKNGVVFARGADIPSTSVGQASVERAIFVLDAIIRDLERRGIGIKLSGQWFSATQGEESVDFKLPEKIAKVKHVPTAADLQAEAQRLRSGGSDYGRYWSKAYPEYDYLLSKYETEERRLDVAEYIAIARAMSVDPYGLVQMAERATLPA
ncbi:hypothetical protein LJR090_004347 [Bosea sp. LjRoot90]|uniref:hypothetical protein n=1 Tax=Bosea sp. LjRoot90 TaxID=3342342 RepID=UPI003ECF93C2